MIIVIFFTENVKEAGVLLPAAVFLPTAPQILKGDRAATLFLYLVIEALLSVVHDRIRHFSEENPLQLC